MNYNSKFLFRIAFAASCSFFTLVPTPTFAIPADAAFLAAREAFRNNEPQRLNRQIAALQDQPLQALAEYWQLRLKLDNRDDSGIPEFLSAQAGSYLADKLRGDWLRFLGNRAEWDRFQRELPTLVQSDIEINCYAAQAAKTPEAVRPLWLSGQDLPRACDVLVDQLVDGGGLNVEEVWQRIRRVFEAKRVGAARSAAVYLPSSEGFENHRLEIIAQAPARYLDKPPVGFLKSRGSREVALFAVQRLARSDPPGAAKRLARLEAQPGAAALSAEERAYAWGQIAWQAAQSHLPEALSWYAKSTASPLGEEALAWQVRAALRLHDWTAVRRAIAMMPPAMAAQPDWIYWQARALAAQDKRSEARALYAKIAGQPNFYSNLADDELGRPINVPTRAAPPTPEEIAAAAANPGLKRAVALIRIDMRVEGLREWSWAVRGMNDRQLLAIAGFAKQNEIWDRAIFTANQTTSQHDYSLRYLAPFIDHVGPKSAALSLDNGWVYGLMRQESRFVTNARSVVGAQGLMQVMPATAKWVAKKIKLANYHPTQAAELETNVTLGTNYLKIVLESLDNHPVLASAAYNAGPGRARRWRGDIPLEGAIYAETIPFSETRDYVKKVMSNAVYYNALFEAKPQSLKSRLGIVRARGTGEIGVDALP